MLSIEEYVKALIDEPFKKQLSYIDKLDETLDEFKNSRPSVLTEFKSHMQRLNGLLSTVVSCKFTLSLDVVMAAITSSMLESQEEWLTNKEEAFSEIDDEITALRSQIEQDNIIHNKSIVEQNKSANINFNALEEKRKILESYSDKIFDKCNLYGISTTDICMDESTFTISELDHLYDEYIKYMNKEESGSNVISKFRSLFPDTTVQGIVFLVLLICCFSSILDFVSIGFFAALAVNQIQQVNKAKYYSILMAIVFNIQPENMGYTALDESLFLPERLTDEMMDTDERFAQFEEKYDTVEKMFDETNPEVETARVMAEWSNAMGENQKHLKECEKIYTDKVECVKSDVEAEIALMTKEYDRLKSEYKTLGMRFSNSLSFNGTFLLGLHDDCIEEYVEVGQRNIVIRPNSDSILMNKFLQALFVNAVSNVFPGKIKVTVYDPNNFGRSIMPLYINDLKDYIFFFNDGLDSILDEHITYVQDNFKTMSGKTIDEYNKMCEETGKTPIEYKLMMILSQPKSLEEDEKLQSFFEYSATGGVFIWVISDSMSPENACLFRKPFEGINHPITDMIDDDWCGKVRMNYLQAIDNAKPKGLLWQDFINNVLPMDKTWTGDASKYVDFYAGYEDGDPGLYKPYTLGNEGNVHAIGVGTSGAGKSVFLNHLIGTMCRKYDPSQLELWLCDFKGVEFKTYMKTLRAKSARLCKPIKAEEGYMPKSDEENQEVLGYYAYNKDTQEYTYSKDPTPDCSELHVFLQSLKFGKPKMKDGKEIPPRPKADINYPDNMEAYALPHIAACLCTSDGAFATSLFHAYRAKADARYEDMKILGVKNMPGWNARVKTLFGTKKPQELVEAHGKETGFNPIWSEDDLWPRVLFVCDEFQVIFQKAGPDNVEKIKEDITQIAKVARACGMHIFFTSQSMKGTISSDILNNFTLRFALRCEAEVSMDIIGTKRAAEIKEKNGYLIVQSQEMKTAEDQKRYKTPFLCDDENSGIYTTSELFDNIRFIYNLAKERGFKDKDVITYEESTKHPISQMIDAYKDPVISSKLPDSGVFFLGNRMAYSTNKAPDNIILTAKNNTNIMSCCSDYTDFVMFFQQLVINIQNNKEPGTIIINTQIHDIGYLCDIEKYFTFPEKHGHLAWEKTSCSEVIKWATGLLNFRRERGIKDKPIWLFLLGWDKGKGVGVESDLGLRSNMTNFLQTCGEYHIHVIFINTCMTGIAFGLINACAYKIAAKCSQDDSTNLIGTRQAGLSYEMKTGWIFSCHDGEITRDKLYISECERQITSTEIVV